MFELFLTINLILRQGTVQNPLLYMLIKEVFAVFAFHFSLFYFANPRNLILKTILFFFMMLVPTLWEREALIVYNFLNV